MKTDDFQSDALVILGHGTELNEDSARPVRQHAGELRRRNLFAEVREAYWKQSPQIKSVLAELTVTRVFVLPLFISEGYFTEEVIPRALGFCEIGEPGCARVQQHGGRTLYYCGPVGTHDSMTEVLLARARDVVANFSHGCAAPCRETTLFIAGHGTRNNEHSRMALERQVERIRSRQVYAEVHAAFIEEEPRVSECYTLAHTSNIVMVPFFISDGLHASEDIPVMLGESERVVQERLGRGEPTWRNPTEKYGKRVWYASSIGSEPLLAEVILERVRDAAQGTMR